MKQINLLNLSRVQRQMGNYRKASRLLKRCIKICQKVDDKICWSNALNELGLLAFHDQKDYRKALHYFEQCLLLNQKRKHEEGQLATLTNISQAYKKLGKYRKALQKLEEALTIADEEDYKAEKVPILYNISKIKTEVQGDMFGFIKYASRAYKLAIEVNDTKGIFFIGRDLGSVFCQMGNKEEGSALLRKSLHVAIQYGIPGVEEIRELLRSC